MMAINKLKFYLYQEYMRIRTDEPRLSTIHPSDLAKLYVSDQYESSLFDTAFSFSSIEHGRK